MKAWILKNIEQMGYKAPTPVQMQTIPLLMQRREVVVAAPTGSGKTAAYAVPILSLLDTPKEEGFRALVVAPTSVLTSQLKRDFMSLGKGKEWNIREALPGTEKELSDKKNGLLSNISEVLMSRYINRNSAKLG